MKARTLTICVLLVLMGGSAYGAFPMILDNIWEITVRDEATFEGEVTFEGTVVFEGEMTGGDIDGATIGATTPGAGTFTDLTANDSLTANCNVAITGDTTTEIVVTITGVLDQDGNLLTVEQNDGTDVVTVDAAGITTVASLVGDTVTASALIVDASTLLKRQYVGTPGSAAITLPMVGVDATDFIVASMNVVSGTTYIQCADPGTDEVVITLNQDPSEEITLSVMAWTD